LSTIIRTCKMKKTDQKGFTHILILLVLLAGLGVGLYLVGQKTNLLPKASVSAPVTPTTTFALTTDKNSYVVGDTAVVTVYGHSDLDASNLFSEKIHFDNTLLQVDSINYGDSFIQNWVEQFSDQDTGTISLVGGVPDPGFRTEVGNPGMMAKISFKVLANGSANITSDTESAIYRNSDNVNILVLGEGSNTVILIGEQPSPSPSFSPPHLLEVPLHWLCSNGFTVFHCPGGVPTPSVGYVFVTSKQYSGDLGGLAGADQKCQDSANAANLEGTWKAWLSDNNASASGRINHFNFPFKRLDGITIANDWADLTDGSIQAPINLTEAGTTVVRDPFNDTSKIWTGTNANGTTNTDGNNCQGWTSSAGFSGSIGTTEGGSNITNGRWSLSGTGASCGNNSYKLYCFEQTGIITPPPTFTPVPIPTSTPSPTATPTPTSTPSPTILPAVSRVFVTSTTYNGNLGGITGADQKCQTSANTANIGGTWKAWLSDTTTSASSRLNHGNIPYKLLNGALIADDWNYLTTYGSKIKINITESGATLDGYLQVWTNTQKSGAAYNPSLVYSCNNWTSASVTNNGRVGTVGESNGWTDYGISQGCNSGGYLYCFEQASLVSNTVAESSVISGNGDGNGDGKVDLKDLSILLTSYNKTSGFPGAIDTNGDGKINSFDFAKIINILKSNHVIR
jgi:hypothetical protein